MRVCQPTRILHSICGQNVIVLWLHTQCLEDSWYIHILGKLPVQTQTQLLERLLHIRAKDKGMQPCPAAALHAKMPPATP